jgi:hypothetical protein
VGEEYLMATTDAKELTNKLLSDEFIVEINGYSSVFVAKCDLPKDSNEIVKIRGAGMERPKYLAGSREIDTIKMEVYLPATGALRTFFHEWKALNDTHDPAQYYRDMTITQKGANNNASIVWSVEDAWVADIENPKLDASEKSKASMLGLTIRCNNCTPAGK